MCTILKFKSCVGRNFDYDISNNEEIITIEKDEFNNKYAIIGICTGLVNDYPLLYDGMNECGLVCGGLAFTNNAHYINMEDVDYGDYVYTPYDFVFQILSSFKTVKEAKEHLNKSHIINKQYSDEFPNSDLHWFIADEKESIIVEQTIDGLKWYEGEVMTNNPPYPNQLTNCKITNQMIGCNLFETYNSRGKETDGLSGGYSSYERFCKVTYLKEQLENVTDKFNQLSETFHLLGSVEQVYGVTSVDNGFEYTIYSTVYDMKNRTMWIKTYDKICPNNYILRGSERVSL